MSKLSERWLLALWLLAAAALDIAAWTGMTQPPLMEPSPRLSRYEPGAVAAPAAVAATSEDDGLPGETEAGMLLMLGVLARIDQSAGMERIRGALRWFERAADADEYVTVLLPAGAVRRSCDHSAPRHPWLCARQ